MKAEKAEKEKAEKEQAEKEQAEKAAKAKSKHVTVQEDYVPESDSDLSHEEEKVPKKVTR